MKKILYLHGLESPQGGLKVDFLSSVSCVNAPEIDYHRNDLHDFLYQIIKDFDPDVIIGSSMGGYAAYVMGIEFGIPVMLFNPALHSRPFEPKLVKFYSTLPPIIKIILGSDDDVIDPKITDDFFRGKILGQNITVIPEMGHRVPLDIFIKAYNEYIK